MFPQPFRHFIHKGLSFGIDGFVVPTHGLGQFLKGDETVRFAMGAFGGLMGE
jgi:hypothetical protein